MKKAIFSVAIALAATLGFTAVAQTPETADAATQQTEQVQGKKVKGDRPEKRHDIKKGDKAGQRHGQFKGQNGRGQFNPFEGLNLTAEQQAALEALCPKKGECKAGEQAQCSKAEGQQCDKAKADKKCDKKDGKKCDKKEGQQCVKGQADKAADHEARKAEAKARKTEFLGKVKEILTPEQYIQFLENNFSIRR